MTTFFYTALDPAGKRKTGFIEAADQKAAIAMISAEGRFVVEIREEQEAGAKAAKSAAVSLDKKRGKASKADIALFTRRMADLSDAGLPLDRVLGVLVEQSEVGALSEAAAAALEDVRGGMQVSDSLAKFPKMFPPVYTMTLAAGEASGQFPQSATKLAELLEKDVYRRSMVVSAMIYPAVLTGTAVIVVIFLLTFVVPRLAGVFADMGDALPAPTKILLGVTGFITNNWALLLGGIVAAVVFYRVWITTRAGIVARDALAMRLPLFGPIVQKMVISRYARVLGTLVFGGVPILEALKLAGLAAGNTVFQESGRVVEDEVREGASIAVAMKDTGVFPPVLTNMVAIGEETGDLPKMLNRVSDSLDFEVEIGLKRLTASLEPVIILFMGAFVAFVVLSVALPIFNAQDTVR